MTEPGKLVDQHGNEVKLSKRSHQILEHFVENPGVIVEELNLLYLFSSANNEDDLKNAKATIHRAVIRLRKQLGDAKKKEIIKTVRGRGFRFEPKIQRTNAALDDTVKVGIAKAPHFDTAGDSDSLHPFNKYLLGQCYFCGKETKYHPIQDRHCCIGNLPEKSRPKGRSSLYPTIYPIPTKHAESPFEPPSPNLRHQLDGFAISQDVASSLANEKIEPPAMPFPFSEAMREFRCGYPIITSLEKLSGEFGFRSGRLKVCDMSTYEWSQTLKDPRSLAVANLAYESGIKHLGVWTAGNAGLSLATIIYRANKVLPENRRITVYCYCFEGELSDEIQLRLQRLNAVVRAFKRPAKGHVFSPDQILDRLNRENENPIPAEQFWDVSDGWDGVGSYMYRLLAHQLLVHLQPRYVVLPVGTCNLFTGFFWGLRDCVKENKLGSECTLIGAVPQGASVVTSLRSMGIDVPIDRNPQEAAPVAPKLATVYTPLLLPVLDAVTNYPHLVELMEVSKQQQKKAASYLFKGPRTWRIGCEPSSVVAFGALGRLARKLVDKEPVDAVQAMLANEDVLVINTGSGVVGPEEREFLSEYYPKI